MISISKISVILVPVNKLGAYVFLLIGAVVHVGDISNIYILQGAERLVAVAADDIEIICCRNDCHTVCRIYNGLLVCKLFSTSTGLDGCVLGVRGGRGDIDRSSFCDGFYGRCLIGIIAERFLILRDVLTRDLVCIRPLELPVPLKKCVFLYLQGADD